MPTWKLQLASCFLLLSIAFGIASLASINWVSDRNIDAPHYVTLQYGLRYWTFTENVGGDVNNRQNYGNLMFTGSDSDLYYFRNFDLVDGDLKSWQHAGQGALAMGIIGMIFLGISFIAGLIGMTRKVASLFTAAPAWFAGFCFILGALLYEGIRPGFHGNQGYEWPMGLYLTCGISADIGSFFYYWNESNPTEGKRSQTADF